jgi:hypothetical protein
MMFARVLRDSRECRSFCNSGEVQTFGGGRLSCSISSREVDGTGSHFDEHVAASFNNQLNDREGGPPRKFNQQVGLLSGGESTSQSETFNNLLAAENPPAKRRPQQQGEPQNNVTALKGDITCNEPRVPTPCHWERSNVPWVRITAVKLSNRLDISVMEVL